MTTYKTFNAQEKRTMSKSQERAVERAFERFDSDAVTVRVPQLEHLRKQFRPGLCCEHKWALVELDEASAKDLKKRFDEQDLGEFQTICTVEGCEALALWSKLPDRFGEEKMTMWAIDARVLERQQEREAKRSSRKEKRQ